MITVEIPAFHEDENGRDGISYMLFKVEDLIIPPAPGDEIIVITPVGIRYAIVDEYDDADGTYYVLYTSHNLTEI